MKQTSYDKGLFAEAFAKNYFYMKGYSLLAERFKTPQGEIDLILKKKNAVVFVEVKLRKTIDEAKEAIHSHNQQRVRAAAELYLQKNPKYNNCELRFDALALAPYTWPCHIENAW